MSNIIHTSLCIYLAIGIPSALFGFMETTDSTRSLTWLLFWPLICIALAVKGLISFIKEDLFDK